MAENNVRTLKVRLFTTKVIKSQVKLYVNSNTTKIPRESTTYITLFTARSRTFLPAAILRVALSWPPHKPTIYARLARWQLLLCFIFSLAVIFTVVLKLWEFQEKHFGTLRAPLNSPGPSE